MESVFCLPLPLALSGQSYNIFSSVLFMLIEIIALLFGHGVGFLLAPAACAFGPEVQHIFFCSFYANRDNSTAFWAWSRFSACPCRLRFRGRATTYFLLFLLC